MDYQLYKEGLPNKSYVKAAIGSGCRTKLVEAFFSNENLNIIQNALRYKVWVQSNHNALISRQSEDELIAVMRATYLQYGKNQPDDIRGQIEDLNAQVVSQIVPKILSEVTGHLLYLKDKFGGLTPLPQPVNVNNAGTRQLSINLV